MERPCKRFGHEKPQNHAGECHLCKLSVTRTDYRTLWGDDPPTNPMVILPPKRATRYRRDLECVHLGDCVDKRGCNSGLRWKHECDLHGACTKEDVHSGLQTCKTCPDYSSEPEVKVIDNRRKVVLHNKQSPGDCLAMTTAIECLHEQHPNQYLTAVRSPCPAIFEHNPYVVPAQPGWEEIDVTYPMVHRSDWEPRHFLEAYVEGLSLALNIPLKLHLKGRRANRPYLYLSGQETSWINQVQEITKEPTRFWLINAGCKQDYTAKQYGHYQKAVDLLRGEVKFVQVGSPEHVHAPLRGVIDLLGRTDLRQLIRLAWHAEGVLSGVSLLMHVAAAFEKPAVIVAGGREPRNWNTYPRQELLSTVGMLPCCQHGGCWKSRVTKLNDGSIQDGSLCENPVLEEVPHGRCMEMIRPEEVAAAVLKFQNGGTLG